MSVRYYELQPTAFSQNIDACAHTHTHIRVICFNGKEEMPLLLLLIRKLKSVAAHSRVGWCLSWERIEQKTKLYLSEA